MHKVQVPLLVLFSCVCPVNLSYPIPYHTVPWSMRTVQLSFSPAVLLANLPFRIRSHEGQRRSRLSSLVFSTEDGPGSSLQTTAVLSVTLSIYHGLAVHSLSALLIHDSRHTTHAPSFVLVAILSRHLYLVYRS